MTHQLVSVYLVCNAVLAFGQTQAPAQPSSAVVRQIDHIIVQVDSVSDARALWSVFSKTLDLPVAWPPADYKGFFSGGVNAGNVNIEFAYSTDESAPPGSTGEQVPRARFSGLGLQPEPLSHAIAELNRLGVRYGEPDAYQVQDENGNKVTLWTTVYLDELSKSMDVFLCEYSGNIFRTNNPPREDIEANRRYLSNQLKQHRGGPLGVDAVREIVIETSSFDTTAKLWERLLRTQLQGGQLQASHGPAIRLVSSATDGIQSIVVRVADLERARQFLKDNHLLGREMSDRISIDPAKLMGIDVQLAQ